MASRKMNSVFAISVTLFLSQIVSNCAASEISPVESIGENGTTYHITKTWDGNETDTDISITFSLVQLENGTQRFIQVDIEAPYFGNPEGPDPEVNSTADPYEGLWEYEVVEAFFLGANEEYLEMEFSPSGHYLLYYLVGVRNPTNTSLRIEAPVVSIDNGTWMGSALIPAEYFPCDVNKFNAYAIHIRPEDAEGGNKTYMSLFPAPPEEFEQPDFHRLELFGDVSFEEEPNQESRCDGSDNSGSSHSKTTLSVLLSSIVTFSFLGLMMT